MLTDDNALLSNVSFYDTGTCCFHVNDRREQSQTMRTQNKRKDENVKIDCPGFDIQSIVTARKADEPSISHNERRELLLTYVHNCTCQH